MVEGGGARETSSVGGEVLVTGKCVTSSVLVVVTQDHADEFQLQ